MPERSAHRIVAGAPDPMGLAVASLGEEARVDLVEAHLLPDVPWPIFSSTINDAKTAALIGSAVRLYVEQAARGSKIALLSLRSFWGAIIVAATPFVAFLSTAPKAAGFAALVSVLVAPIGLAVGTLGAMFPGRVILGIGSYQLLVADACAGLHTLFTLEHNAICDRLTREYPAMTDDELRRVLAGGPDGDPTAPGGQAAEPELGRGRAGRVGHRRFA